MALTSISTPSNFDSAYRPCEWTFDTNVSNLEAVKYTLLVGATVVNNLTVQSIYGNTNRFTVDFAPFIQDYLANDIGLLSTSGTLIEASGIINTFTVSGVERILSASGTFSDGGSLTSSGYKIVNTSLDIGESLTGYFVNTDNAKILTNKPSFITRSGEGEMVGIYNNEEAVKVTITTTDTSGTVASGIVNSISSTSLISYLGIGYKNINAYSLSTGSQPLIDANTASYTVQFETVTTGNTFELISVEVDREYREEKVQIAFLNKFGAIDFFTFASYQNKMVEIESNNANRVVSDYTDKTSFGNFKPSTKEYKMKRIGSRNITYDVVEWLMELIGTPNAWVVENDVFLPIIINTDSFTYYNSLNQIFNVELEFSYSNYLRRQKGW